ncbi:hypothetical protein B0I35DRAFT_481879 [Stachybotrys elegans]|uniref:RRM domain-containing protein n=1 Tax=Stachybotrys elegans TaxID=80388 RepID=A0A8K0SKW2_9HYPO|nr:hypothetical protein B0I35DRAFT_481879 [Stachybotrys elegans]
MELNDWMRTVDLHRCRKGRLLIVRSIHFEASRAEVEGRCNVKLSERGRIRYFWADPQQTGRRNPGWVYVVFEKGSNCRKGRDDLRNLKIRGRPVEVHLSKYPHPDGPEHVRERRPGQALPPPPPPPPAAAAPAPPPAPGPAVSADPAGSYLPAWVLFTSNNPPAPLPVSGPSVSGDPAAPVRPPLPALVYFGNAPSPAAPAAVPPANDPDSEIE